MIRPADRIRQNPGEVIGILLSKQIADLGMSLGDNVTISQLVIGGFEFFKDEEGPFPT
jgi:hypothetical protein